ncbi:uncharacterized protein LOC110924646 [Helianthus annuus]|uniref:uncharacterized protein LOC110924646 n=1 Tax=Helianthus annuus TaxID=4232 RepID=UPI000B90429F|nr:uncharacterized protein LOC110924646 [Helianthus annuus]
MDTWLGSNPLRVQFPSLYLITTNKKALVSECYRKINSGRLWDWKWERIPNSESELRELNDLYSLLQLQRISCSKDVWYWHNFEQQDLSTKVVRQALNRNIDLNDPATDFVWNRWTTNKSLMFVWRAMEGKIQTAAALRNRGLNIPDTSCKICGAAEETAEHVLIQCNFAKRIWDKIANWIGIPMINLEGSIKDLFQELFGLQRSKKVRKAIHAIAIQTMWALWKNRNGKVFSNKHGPVQLITEEIKEASYKSLKARSKYTSITCQEWWDFNVVW